MLRSSLAPAPITAITGIALPGERRDHGRAHLAHGVEEAHQREAGAQRRPADSGQVGNPAVVRIPPSVRITSDSCRRAISGFSIAATGRPRLAVMRGCFDGGAGVFLSALAGCGSLLPDGSRSAATTQAEAASAPSDEADHRQQAHGRREGAPLRHGRLADDARARGVEAFLFLGFARALEEGLIDVAAGLDVALEFAQPHRGLAELDALALLRLQRLVQRGFVVAGARQVVLRRLREAFDFFV